jgi:hypothetical protein
VLVYTWWRAGRWRAATLLALATMLMASFSTSIRIHSGLPLLLGALGIVSFTGVSNWRALRRFWKLPRWWVRPAVAAGLVLAYLSIATFGFAGVRAYRNHVIHQPTFGSAWPTQHPFWHNAYIGLGFLPNKYGISWNDSVSADAVQRAKPGTGFLTTTYESTLRHLYRNIATNDPGFVVRNFWTKSRILVADAVSRFWPVLLLLPAAALAGRRRREMRVALLVAVPAALFGAIAPVLTIPETSYELAWLGTWGALFILALAWLWVTVAEVAHADPPTELAPLRRRPDPVALEALRARLTRSRAAWAAAAGLALLVLLAAVARPAPQPGSGSTYISEQAPFVDGSWIDRQAIRSWNFAGALPRGWQDVGGAFLERDNGETANDGLYVRSPVATEADQLAGPEVRLPAGAYDLVATGRSYTGGFKLQVRDATSTLVSSGYSALQTDYLTKSMWAHFVLTQPTTVRVIVVSWSTFPNASAWLLWRVKLLAADAQQLAAQASADASYYRAHASHPAAPKGKATSSWDFSAGLSTDWSELQDPLVQGGTITTTNDPAGAQFGSAPVALRPGTYRFVVDGAVEAGGIELRAVEDTSTVIASGRFWQGQKLGSNAMGASFTLRKAANVQFYLLNWGHTPHVSVWSLRRASLYAER